MKGLKRIVRDEDGSIMIFFMILLVVIMSVTALVVDTGLFYYQQTRLQTALDSAALAAARSLPSYNNAQATAFSYLTKNGIDTTGVSVEFPTNDSIRVKKTLQTKTFFGRVMGVNALYSAKKATAKYTSQSLMLDFPYLMFQGSKTATMQMQGQFAINGKIHTNGGIYINGGGVPSGVTSPYGDWKSYISGIVTGSSPYREGSYYLATVWNVGTYYYNWWSTNVEEVVINVDTVQMPDYDADIMAIAPTFSGTGSTVTNAINAATSYSSYYIGITLNDQTSVTLDPPYLWTNFYTTLYNYYGKTKVVNGSSLPGGWPYSIQINTAFNGRNHPTTFYHSVYFKGGANFNSANTIYEDCLCNGDLKQTGGATNLYIGGDLYVKGNVEFSGNVTVDGSIYCTGNYKQGGGTTLTVGGGIYCDGNVELQGTTTVGGDILCLGTFVKGGGTMLTCHGDIYSGSNMTFNGGLTMPNGVIYCGDVFTTGSGNAITISGVIIAEKNMNIGGVPTNINTDSGSTTSMYSRKGNIVFSQGSNGTYIYGMIYAPKGNIQFGSGGLYFYGSIISDTITCGSGGLCLGVNTRQLPFAKTTKMSILIE